LASFDQARYYSTLSERRLGLAQTRGAFKAFYQLGWGSAGFSALTVDPDVVGGRHGCRRARGTGSIFFHEGRQKGVARKTVRGTKLERWGNTQKEAIDKLAEALPPDPNTLTVAKWAERWRRCRRAKWW